MLVLTPRVCFPPQVRVLTSKGAEASLVQQAESQRVTAEHELRACAAELLETRQQRDRLTGRAKAVGAAREERQQQRAAEAAAALTFAPCTALPPAEGGGGTPPPAPVGSPRAIR